MDLQVARKQVEQCNSLGSLISRHPPILPHNHAKIHVDFQLGVDKVSSSSKEDGRGFDEPISE